MVIDETVWMSLKKKWVRSGSRESEIFGAVGHASRFGLCPWRMVAVGQHPLNPWHQCNRYHISYLSCFRQTWWSFFWCIRQTHTSWTAMRRNRVSHESVMPGPLPSSWSVWPMPLQLRRGRRLLGRSVTRPSRQLSVCRWLLLSALLRESIRGQLALTGIVALYFTAVCFWGFKFSGQWFLHCCLL